MSGQTRLEALATAIGADVKSFTTDVLAGARVDRDTETLVRDFNKRTLSRLDAATLFTEDWANTAAWTGTGVVAGGRMYSTLGVIRTAPTATRWVARSTLHATGVASKYAYFGVGSSTNANDFVGIGQGSASTTAAILRGSNISAGNLTLPRGFPVLAAGDYICTIARDETTVSLTIQKTTGGQDVWGARVPVSGFPGGVVNTIFMSANDTVGGGLNWGPLSIYQELAIPPVVSWSVGGIALWGANKPLSFYRADPTTGIGHVISIPGDDDPSTPSPVMLFMHQAQTGVAISPWSEARMANVTAAMETAGYIIIASDNGPGITGGGTQDKFANQAGQDDYAALVDWTRQHFNTGSLVLLGPSQGSFFTQNILMSKAIGGIAAVATISGGSDLMLLEQDVAFQAALRSAYGAADTPSFIIAATPFNPISQPGWRFRGVPQRFYVGTGDVTAPPAVQITPFVAKIAPYSVEESVVSLAVGHLDASLYQGTDLLAFYQKYVRNSDFAVTSDARLLARANHTGTQSADTLTDGTTNKAFLATERIKLAAIATAATANAPDATLLARANHTGTQSADTLTDGTTNKAFLATERTKLGAIATAATANAPDATLLARANHTGSQDLDTTTDSATRLAMTSAERTKVAGVAAGATANSSDATLLNRANHTGTQTISTITGLVATTTIVSSATPTPTGDALRNMLMVTAQAANAVVAAPTGTPTDGNSLVMRIEATGAYTLALNAIFRAIGVTIPTALISGKNLYIGAFYNANDSKWDVTAVAQEA